MNRARPKGMSGRQWVRYRKENGIVTKRHLRNPQWSPGKPRGPRAQFVVDVVEAFTLGRKPREAEERRLKKLARRKKHAG